MKHTKVINTTNTLLLEHSHARTGKFMIDSVKSGHMEIGNYHDHGAYVNQGGGGQRTGSQTKVWHSALPVGARIDLLLR